MIKTFTLAQDKEVNAFIETVTEPQITITDNTIAVTYESEKANYEDYFLNKMIGGLERNLFNERILKVSLDAEVETLKEMGTNLPDFDEQKNKQKACEKNIARFEAKLKALTEWRTSKS